MSDHRGASRTRLLAVAVAAGLLLGACDSDRRAISRADLPSVPRHPDAQVDLDEGGFAVDRITVHTDDLVEFVNTGDDQHGIRTADSAIDTGLLLPGESTFVVFDRAAEYEVFDVSASDHTMTVVARAPPSAG